MTSHFQVPDQIVNVGKSTSKIRTWAEILSPYCPNCCAEWFVHFDCAISTALAGFVLMYKVTMSYLHCILLDALLCQTLDVHRANIGQIYPNYFMLLSCLEFICSWCGADAATLLSPLRVSSPLWSLVLFLQTICLFNCWSQQVKT